MLCLRSLLYLHILASQEQILSPGSFQQEERSTFEIWAPPDNIMGIEPPKHN